MTDDATRARLAALEERLEKAKGVQAPVAPKGKDYQQANLAWRMVIELVAGLMIGFGIGFGLDKVFGTMPLFLVLFILAGLAAGIKTMLRSAREVQARQAAIAAASEGEDNGG